MSKIGIVAKVEHPPVDLLRAIAPHSDAGLAELGGRFREGEAVVVRPVTGTEWKEAHEDLRAVVHELQTRGIAFHLWEALDDQELLDGRPITPEILENILRRHADAYDAALDEGE